MKTEKQSHQTPFSLIPIWDDFENWNWSIPYMELSKNDSAKKTMHRFVNMLVE